MGWLIALGIVVLLAILPLGVSAIYNAEGPLIRIIAGPVKIKVFPLKKKAGTEKQKKPKEKKKADTATAKANKPKKSGGGSITDFLPLVQVALDFLNEFRKKLRVNRLELKIILGGGDPCDLGINYGKAWTAVGNLMPQLERFLVIKKRDLQVECDFTADTTFIYARADVTITLGRLLYLLVRYGVRALKQYLKIQKGGAVT